MADGFYTGTCSCGEVFEAYVAHWTSARHRVEQLHQEHIDQENRYASDNEDAKGVARASAPTTPDPETDYDFICREFDLGGYFSDQSHTERAEERLRAVVSERDAYKAAWAELRLQYPDDPYEEASYAWISRDMNTIAAEYGLDETKP